MAKNKIQIDVMVNGKMEKATISAKKLKKALDGAQNSQDQLNTSTRQGYRAAQGAAQNTSNTTKAFAKQAGVVGGLVPVYATFAANVFAVSAAFGVLSRNAAVQQLETSLNNIGIAAGRNLPLVASNLKDITGGAISTEAALRATAVATTSGFSTKQLQDLTKVATGASIALGRNLPDALDRLVRGTAKLEPEILDELGIIVRLDQATREYAASLGKTSQELTQFERQQAFLNATIDQGLSKYEKIAQAVDPNPYDRLSAAFTDLLKSSVELANKGLVPIIEFLAESPSGLFAALGLFSTTIVSQIIPAISDMASASADRFAMTAKDAKKAAKKITNEYADAAKDIQVLDFMPKGFKANADLLKSGTKDAKVYNDSLKSLRISQSKRVIEIQKVKAASADLSGFQKQASQQYLATKEAELAAIELEIQRTLQLQRIQQQGFIGPVVVGGGSVQKAQKEARVTGARARSQDIEKKGLDDIAAAAGPLAALTVFFSTIPDFIKNLDGLKGGSEKATQSFRSLGSAGKLLGAVFSRLLGPLSVLLLAYSVLSPVVKKFIGGQSELEKATDKAAGSFTNIAKIVIAFKKELITIDSDLKKTYRSMEVAAGITDQTAGALAKLQEEADKITLNKLDTQINNLLESEAKRERIKTGNAGFFSQIFSDFIQPGLTKDINEANTEINKLLETIGKVPKANALVVLTQKVQLLRSSGAAKLFPEIEKSYNQLIAELKRGDPSELIDIDPLVRRLDDSAKGYRTLESAVKGAAQALQEFDAARAKLTAGDRTRYSQSIKASQRYINELTSQFKQTPGQVEATLGLGIDVAELSKGDQAQARFLEKQYNLAEGSIKDGSVLLSIQKSYNAELLKAEDTLVTNKGVLKEQQATQKRINNLASMGGGFIEAQLMQEKEVLDTKVDVLDAQIALNDKLMDEEEALLANKSLIAEKKALQAEANNEALIAYRREQDSLRLAQESFSIEQKKLDIIKRQNDVLTRQEDRQLKANARERNKSRTGRFFEDRRALEDQIKTEKARLERNKAFLKAEADQKKLNVAIEYALLDAKYAYLAAEAQQLADELRTPTKDKDGNLKPITEEAENRAKALDKSIGVYNKLKKALGAEKLEIIVGADGTIQRFANVEGGILGGLFGAINSETQEGVKDLTENITELEQKLKDLEPVSVALDAAVDTLSQGLGDAFNSVIDGAKSAKEAIADLATSILQSFRKVLADELANRFIEFVGSKIPSFGGKEKFNEVNTVNPAYQTNQDATANPLGNLTMDPSMGKPAPGALATATSMDVGMAGLDGMGLGASAAKPVYVTMVENPLGGGLASAETAATTGAVGGDLGGVAEDPATKATKENTAATKKLNLNTASAVTAGLATVAALTGNEKAAAALALVTAALQVAQLFQSTVTTTDTAVTAASTAAITTALAANTFALAANTQMLAISTFGFRNGGISTPTGPMKGYSEGGISKGSQGGYPVMLHGTEAVVPLPNGKSIPVEMSGSAGGMQQNNVSVNVVMNQDGSTDTQTEGQDAENLGKRISLLVQKELVNQKRVGGMLSGIGAV